MALQTAVQVGKMTWGAGLIQPLKEALVLQGRVCTG